MVALHCVCNKDHIHSKNCSTFTPSPKAVYPLVHSHPRLHCASDASMLSVNDQTGSKVETSASASLALTLVQQWIHQTRPILNRLMKLTRVQSSCRRECTSGYTALLSNRHFYKEGQQQHISPYLYFYLYFIYRFIYNAMSYDSSFHPVPSYFSKCRPVFEYLLS